MNQLPPRPRSLPVTTRWLLPLLALPLLLPVLACARFYLTGGEVTLSRARLHLHKEGRCRALLVPGMCARHNSWLCSRGHSYSTFTACKGNLKNLGTALEMWADDHADRYPSSLAQLTPAYLRSIPRCPDEDVGCPANSGYVLQSTASNYTVVCTGLKHTAAGVSSVNYPQYTCAEGLRER